MTSKHEQLDHLLCSSNIDFSGVTETWLTHSSPEETFFKQTGIKGGVGEPHCMSKAL